MTIEASPADEAAKKAPKAAHRRRFVQVAPDSDIPETRPKLSAARGLLIGAGVCTAFWAVVAAAAMAVRH